MDIHDEQDFLKNYPEHPAHPCSFPRAQPCDFRRPENGVYEHPLEIFILKILRHAEGGVKCAVAFHLVHPCDALLVFADVALLQQRGRLRQRAGLVEFA